MAEEIQCNYEKKEGATLEVKLSWRDDNPTFIKFSKAFVLCGLVSIQLKADGYPYKQPNGHSSVKGNLFLMFKRNQSDDHLNYSIQYIEDGHVMKNFCFCFEANDISVKLIKHWRAASLTSSYTFNCTLVLGLFSNPRLELLFQDTELTDFQLIGVDGSVPVHRIALSLYSEALKAMVTGPWMEAKEGRTETPTSVKTLTHLKEYMYLDKLPDIDVELELLLELACYYQITDLMRKCCSKLLFVMNSDNIVHLSELAVRYKLKTLLFVIMLEAAKVIKNDSSFSKDWQ